MPASYPYVNAPGPLITLLEKLRNAFPATVNVETLKKLGLAAKNESYVINTLQFLGVINEEGTKDTTKAKIFVSDDQVYHDGMITLVQNAYSDLFETHGDAAWGLDRRELVTFFRMSDGTSEIVGGRQASTFEVLAAQAGKREPSVTVRQPASNAAPKKPGPKKAARHLKKPTSSTAEVGGKNSGGGVQHPRDVELAVKIELNLPATDDPAVYDALFKSLREHLIDASKS